MAAFSPAMLVPAAQVSGFTKDAGQRTTKQVALDNIAKMKAQFADPKLEGKRNFKTVGEFTAFSIRVNNTAMELEVFIDGKAAMTKEPSVPTKHFADALDYFAKQIEDGKYADQLGTLDTKREARSTKMRQTRAAKPKVDKPKA